MTGTVPMAEANGDQAGTSADAAAAKSATAFRTISEASAEIGVPAHVLRFWETRFVQLRPLKRAGGRRYYRPADMALLRRIHRLLHHDGMTIRGAVQAIAGTSTPAAAASPADAAATRARLIAIRARLAVALAG
jgi:DNA-binding transcriptional MerR regulator